MLIVQKYGGTSVGNPDRIKNVAARVAKYRANTPAQRPSQTAATDDSPMAAAPRAGPSPAGL